MPRLTPYTEINPHRVLKILEHAREIGEIVEHERFVLGWSCLAVPIFDITSNQPVAVLGVVNRTPRFAADQLLRIAHTTAGSISRRWSSQWPSVPPADNPRDH